MRRAAAYLVALALTGCVAACVLTPAAPGTGGGGLPSASPVGPSTSPAPPAPAGTPSATAPTTNPSVASSPTLTPPTGPAPSCTQSVVDRMTPAERVGQLIWVGLDVRSGATSLDPLVVDRHVGGVVLLGGWSGADTVRDATTHLHALGTGGVATAVSADQEGGAVQQVRGDGIPAIPSATRQNSMTPGELESAAGNWGQTLREVGVDVNLAPVADTVPAVLGRGNEPIGRWNRQFSADPDRNAVMVSAFIAGMHAAGVATTVKHFPGLGRVQENTDLSADGTTDDTTTAGDAYLRPFAAGISAGTDLVMVSSATYARIDPTQQALFSSRIVSDLLRGTLGYAGVVISDDVGAASAVAAVSPADRAIRAVSAGIDIVLTAQPADVPAMTDALINRAATDPSFAARLGSSTNRVVALKAARGLVNGCRS